MVSQDVLELKVKLEDAESQVHLVNLDLQVTQDHWGQEVHQENADVTEHRAQPVSEALTDFQVHQDLWELSVNPGHQDSPEERVRKETEDRTVAKEALVCKGHVVNQEQPVPQEVPEHQDQREKLDRPE